MQKDIQQKFINDAKMLGYLKQNSHYIKALNRNPDSYKEFENAMKEKYKTRITDKVTEAIDNIDMVASILNVLK